MAEIHSTAIVHPSVRLGEGTCVGPYSIIDEGVVVGKECHIREHVVVRRLTRIGDRVKLFPFVVLGEEPQHLKYRGEDTYVKIGDDAILREMVTVHRGTTFGNYFTEVGEGSLLMAYCHVAHDCVVGKNVIMANEVQLAGHSEVEDRAVIGGMTGIGQFCRVGRYCFVGGCSGIRKDVPPFMAGKGNDDFRVQSVNAIGLARNGFNEDTINCLKKMYKIFYRRHLTLNRAIESIQNELGERDEVRLFVDFVKKSKMGIAR